MLTNFNYVVLITVFCVYISTTTVSAYPAPQQDAPPPSCDTMKCAAGSVCELEQVNCFVAPCYPIPVCTPVPDSTNPCKTYQCPPNSRCVLRDVICKKAPCPRQTYCERIQVDGKIWSRKCNTVMDTRC